MKNLLFIFLLLPMFMFSQKYKLKESIKFFHKSENKTWPNGYGYNYYKGINEKNQLLSDGFQTWFGNDGNLCLLFFSIHGTVVYKKDIECYELSNLGHVGDFDISEYDLEPMIKLFLKDLYNSIERTDGLKINNNYIERVKISVDFQELGGNTLAISSGIYDDENIKIKIDPSKWKDATSIERWYTIYHELGHDVLNFKHGEGGKMMFNYTFNDYSWYDFEEDRQYMFESYIDKLNQQKSRLN